MTGKLGIAGCVVLLASPLVAWPGFGYDTLRLPFVAAGTALLFAEGLVLSLRRQGAPRPRRAWIAAAGALVGAHLLSMVTAVNLDAAWGTLVPIIAFIAIFWAVARGWVEQGFQQGILETTAGVTGVFTGLGLAQWAFRSTIFFGSWGADARMLPRHQFAISTIGNTNYAGALSAILACVCIGGALAGGPLRRRVVCAIAALLAVAHVAASNSRGAMLGLAAGGLAVAGLLALRREWKAAAVSVLMIVLAATLNSGRAARVVARDDTARVRLGLWRGTVRLAVAYPLVGCGAGNFQFQFPPFRDPEEFEISNRGADTGVVEAREPHSTPLLVVAETGPLGLAGFLALLVLAAIVALRGVRLADPSGAALLIAPAGGLGAFAVAGLFNSLHDFSPFDVLAGGLLGLIASTEARAMPRGLSDLLLRATGLAAALFLFVGSIQRAITERHFWNAMHVVRTPYERAGALQAALRAQPDFWEAHYQLGYLQQQVQEYAGAIEEYSRVLQLHPHSINTLNNLAMTLAYVGERARGEPYLRHAADIQPNDWRTQYNLGVLTEARQPLLRAIELNPRYGLSYYYVGMAALREEMRPDAVEWFRKAKARGVDVGARLRQMRLSLQGDPAFAEFFEEKK